MANKDKKGSDSASSKSRSKSKSKSKKPSSGEDNSNPKDPVPGQQDENSKYIWKFAQKVYPEFHFRPSGILVVTVFLTSFSE